MSCSVCTAARLQSAATLRGPVADASSGVQVVLALTLQASAPQDEGQMSLFLRRPQKFPWRLRLLWVSRSHHESSPLLTRNWLSSRTREVDARAGNAAILSRTYIALYGHYLPGCWRRLIVWSYATLPYSRCTRGRNIWWCITTSPLRSSNVGPESLDPRGRPATLHEHHSFQPLSNGLSTPRL